MTLESRLDSFRCASAFHLLLQTGYLPSIIPVRLCAIVRECPTNRAITLFMFFLAIKTRRDIDID